MKKKVEKKLVLHKQTLRILSKEGSDDEDALRTVAGGNTNSCSCPKVCEIN